MAKNPDIATAVDPQDSLVKIATRARRVVFAHSVRRGHSGVVSVTGPAAGAVRSAREHRELVAIVLAAGSHRSVTDATVEVLTTENALVATLTPDSTGRVTQELREGVYVVRVSHPRYAADVRRIQVQPRQTIEIKTTLRTGSSSPLERAVSKGAGSIRRALGF
jgi:hypothetical protein